MGQNGMRQVTAMPTKPKAGDIVSDRSGIKYEVTGVGLKYVMGRVLGTKDAPGMIKISEVFRTGEVMSGN